MNKKNYINGILQTKKRKWRKVCRKSLFQSHQKLHNQHLTEVIRLRRQQEQVFAPPSQCMSIGLPTQLEYGSPLTNLNARELAFALVSSSPNLIATMLVSNHNNKLAPYPIQCSRQQQEDPSPPHYQLSYQPPRERGAVYNNRKIHYLHTISCPTSLPMNGFSVGEIFSNLLPSHAHFIKTKIIRDIILCLTFIAIICGN